MGKVGEGKIVGSKHEWRESIMGGRRGKGSFLRFLGVCRWCCRLVAIAIVRAEIGREGTLRHSVRIEAWYLARTFVELKKNAERTLSEAESFLQEIFVFIHLFNHSVDAKHQSVVKHPKPTTKPHSLHVTSGSLSHKAACSRAL